MMMRRSLIGRKKMKSTTMMKTVTVLRMKMMTMMTWRVNPLWSEYTACDFSMSYRPITRGKETWSTSSLLTWDSPPSEQRLRPS